MANGIALTLTHSGGRGIPEETFVDTHCTSFVDTHRASFADTHAPRVAGHPYLSLCLRSWTAS
jgi:hypothetical protein